MLIWPRGAVEDGTLADVEEFHALVPMPGSLASKVACALHEAGDMRKVRRITGQMLFPAIGV